MKKKCETSSNNQQGRQGTRNENITERPEKTKSSAWVFKNLLNVNITDAILISR